MPTHSELANWDRHHFWHSFTQMETYESVVIDRAEGVWIFDTSGKKYLDGVSSMWCNLHGHNHPRLNEAIQTQLGRVAHTTSLGQGNCPAAILAKRLADSLPGDLQHIFYASVKKWQAPYTNRFTALIGSRPSDTQEKYF